MKVVRLFAVAAMLPAACMPRENNESSVQDVAGRVTFGPWKVSSSEFLNVNVPDCRQNRGDVVEPGARLRKMADACLGSEEFRPVIDLASTSTYSHALNAAQERAGVLSPFGLQNESTGWIVGNVGHLDANKAVSFVVARVPQNAFDGAQGSYLIESFVVGGVSAAHGMIRIRFASPVVTLYRQYPAGAQPLGNVQDLIFSVHAVPKRGGRYDPLGAGVQDGMALARGIYTLDNKVKTVKIAQRHKVEQIPLKMSGEQLKSLFSAYVRNSPNRLGTQSYHTWRRNCGTELLEALKEGIGTEAPGSFDHTPVFESIGNLVSGNVIPDLHPGKVRPALFKRGLVTAENVASVEWDADPTVAPVVTRLSR